MTDVLPSLGQILPFSPRPKASRSGGVSGGRGLSHFAGQGGGWPAVVGGGWPTWKWRPDAVAINLE